MERGKKSQIWVENAIYILIAVIIIAALLTISFPQIEKIKDRGILTQTLDAINVLDEKINIVQQSGEGNARVVEFTVAKGKLEIDAPSDTIRFIMEDTRLELSEVGEMIEYENKIFIKTERFGGRFKIVAEKEYSDIMDITHNGEETLRTLQSGPTPYSITFQNLGSSAFPEKPNIDINV